MTRNLQLLMHIQHICVAGTAAIFRFLCVA